MEHIVFTSEKRLLESIFDEVNIDGMVIATVATDITSLGRAFSVHVNGITAGKMAAELL